MPRPGLLAVVLGDVSRAGDAARSEFQTRVATLSGQVQGDITCIGQQAANAQARADGVRAMLTSGATAPSQAVPRPQPAPQIPAPPRPFR